MERVVAGLGFGRFAPSSVEDVAVTTGRRTLTGLAFACVGVLSVGVTATNAAIPRPTSGYWLAGADGGVFSFDAPFYGSGTTPPGACYFSPQAPSTRDSVLGCVAIASTPSGSGYWLLNAFRSSTAFGQAGQALQAGCTGANGATGPWTGIASSPTGNGFFVTSSNGGVEGCGDAVPFGGLTAMALNAPVAGIATTPDGKGYWLVAEDGGVFAFGDAPFEGSMAGTRLNAPVAGIATTPDGKGYWLVAEDGGVFAFGDASF
jgi:hypothetical protein